MNISIIGTGYVGLVSGICFADVGNNVICVDTDSDKIEDLKQGILPIYEPGLEEMLKDNNNAKRITFTTNIKDALQDANICIIAVGTPMNEDGSADLGYILSAAKSIGKYITKHTYIVDKSTVPVGTAEMVKNVVRKELKERCVKVSFDVISNPEFLKEGAAIEDFLKPDRIIIGVENEDSALIMKELYEQFVINHDKLIFMDLKSAEMTKYAANAMLATKISFINEIANICEIVGANVNLVRKGIGSDSRIGYDFIYPGCGYGGSCFPKDVGALISSSFSHGYEPILLEAVEKVNRKQKLVLVQKIIKYFGEDLSNRRFGIWGLSFKPGTDDMRESSSISIINALINMGAEVNVYDPEAMDNARNYYFKGQTKITYYQSKYEALNGVDSLVLVTEWKEFRVPDMNKMFSLMKYPVIFDGRNIYNKDRFVNSGFEIFQIGIPN